MRKTHEYETISDDEEHLRCEECQQPLWKAGDIAPAGTYVRVDDQSYRSVILNQEGPLPATFDGHVALYCTSACACNDRVGRRHLS